MLWILRTLGALLLPWALLACQTNALRNILWKTYTHPLYQFTFEHPRSWELSEGGELATALLFLAPTKDPVFRANGNIVVEPLSPKFDLKRWADLSVLQLGAILDEYQLLGRTQREVDGRPAEVLRSRYKSTTDERIIETYLTASTKHQYVLTFHFRKEQEELYRSTIDAMVERFHIAEE